MGVELLTSKQAIENETRVRQTAGLDGQWRDSAAVCGVGSAQPRQCWIIIGAISGAVLVLVAHESVHCD